MNAASDNGLAHGGPIHRDALERIAAGRTMADAETRQHARRQLDAIDAPDDPVQAFADRVAEVGKNAQGRPLTQAELDACGPVPDILRGVTIYVPETAR